MNIKIVLMLVGVFSSFIAECSTTSIANSHTIQMLHKPSISVRMNADSTHSNKSYGGNGIPIYDDYALNLTKHQAYDEWKKKNNKKESFDEWERLTLGGQGNGR